MHLLLFVVRDNVTCFLKSDWYALYENCMARDVYTEVGHLGGQVPCAAVSEACLVMTVAPPQCPTRRYLPVVWLAAIIAVDRIKLPYTCASGAPGRMMSGS